VEPSGDPEEFALEALELGAEDVDIDGGEVEVYTAPEDFESVRGAVEGTGQKVESAELTMVPVSYLELDPKQAIQTLHLVDALEELDDVQQVYTNVDMGEEVLMEYESELAG
jgi:transcriptional/translational regulatory protein YebC/TACO1